MSDTLLIHTDEIAEFPFTVDNQSYLTLRLSFREDKNKFKNQDPSIDLDTNGDIGTIIFTDWTEPFGAAISKPFVFAGTKKGEEISLLAHILKLGDLYKIDFQIMKQGG